MASKTARIRVSLTGGGKAAAEAGKVSKSLDKLRRQTLSAGRAGKDGAAGLSGFERRILSIDTSSGRLSHSLGLTSKAFAAIKYSAMAAGAVTAGVAAQTVKAGLGFNAAFQSAETSFTTLLGSGSRAKQFMDDLREVSAGTPLRFTEVMDAAKRMVGMGMSADQTNETLKSLNMAVLATGGNSETFDRAALALGQIQAKGKASAEELMQLAEAGVPVNKILQKELKMTGEEVSKIGESGVESDKVIDAITRGWAKKYSKAAKNARGDFTNQVAGMTKDWEQLQRVVTKPLFDKLTEDVLPVLGKGIRSAIKGMETGGFDGMFAGLDKGLGAGGRISAAWADIKVAAEDAGRIVREVFVPAVTGAWDILRKLPNPLGVVKDLLGVAARNTRTLAKVLKVLIVGYIAYRTVALTVAAVQSVLIARRKVLIALETLHRRTMITAMLAQSLWMKSSALMAGMLSRLRGMWIALNLVMRANPVMMIVTGLMLLGAGFVLAYKKIGWFRDGVNAVWSWIKDNWPTLLAILTGPIGLAVKAIIDNWGTLKGAASSVVVWIKDRFAWVKDKISAAFGVVASVGRAVFNALKAPIEWIVDKIKWILDKVPDLPSPSDLMPGGSSMDDIAADVAARARGPRQGRASGGPVTARQTYVVGERGPEVFVPRASGTIIPNHAITPAGGGTFTIHNHVILDGRQVARSVNRVRLDEQARA